MALYWSGYCVGVLLYSLSIGLHNIIDRLCFLMGAEPRYHRCHRRNMKLLTDRGVERWGTGGTCPPHFLYRGGQHIDCPPHFSEWQANPWSPGTQGQRPTMNLPWISLCLDRQCPPHIFKAFDAPANGQGSYLGYGSNKRDAPHLYTLWGRDSDLVPPPDNPDPRRYVCKHWLHNIGPWVRDLIDIYITYGSSHVLLALGIPGVHTSGSAMYGTSNLLCIFWCHSSCEM